MAQQKAGQFSRHQQRGDVGQAVAQRQRGGIGAVGRARLRVMQPNEDAVEWQVVALQ